VVQRALPEEINIQTDCKFKLKIAGKWVRRGRIMPKIHGTY
jgi:hypothetical protein